ncbi:MAG: aminotransferase class I/II-fold pyridoxal phosphate-dependent enzyme [Gemmatimonadaceae bacterium]
MTQSGPPLSPAALSSVVRGMAPSATLGINERSNALMAAGSKVYKFGLGQSPFPVPPSVVGALQAAAGEKDYLPVRGLRALQESVARYLTRRIGMDRGASQVIIGPGSKELMFIVQLALDAELLVPNPSWVSYVPQARLLGRDHRWLETDLSNGWKLTAESLDEHCAKNSGRPRLLILNYPNNPTGVTYDDAELADIAIVARQHGVLVLSDEIYADIHHRGAHCSIATHYPEGTIVSTGLSKWAGAGGWRLGLVSFPAELEWLAAAVAAVASETFTSVSAPIQYAAITAFDGGPEIEDYLSHCRKILALLGRYCAATLCAAGAIVAEPDGAFYLFPDFSPLRARLASRGRATSADFTEMLLSDTGVATLPGTAFGRPESELTLRLSYVNFDGAAALAAAQAGGVLDEQFLRLHCPDSVEAINRMAEWSSH